MAEIHSQNGEGEHDRSYLKTAVGVKSQTTDNKTQNAKIYCQSSVSFPLLRSMAVRHCKDASDPKKWMYGWMDVLNPPQPLVAGDYA